MFFSSWFPFQGMKCLLSELGDSYYGSHIFWSGYYIILAYFYHIILPYWSPGLTHYPDSLSSYVYVKDFFNTLRTLPLYTVPRWAWAVFSNMWHFEYMFTVKYSSSCRISGEDKTRRKGAFQNKKFHFQRPRLRVTIKFLAEYTVLMYLAS